MKHTLKRHKATLFSLSLLAFVLVAGFTVTQFRKADVVRASASDNFTGFAWSDMPNGSDECMVGAPGCGGNSTNLQSGRGAGWISFNSTDIASGVDYGVNVDASGVISGTAWSEHVGWISFDSVTGCPGTAPCTPTINMTTGVFSGWARALSPVGNPQAGGWDGWIALANNGTGGPAYGLTVNTTTGDVSGYAWGSDVLGWIDFNNVQIAMPTIAPSLTLVANPPCSTVTDLTYASPAGTAFTSCTLTSTPTTGVNGDTMPADHPLPTVSNQIIAGIPISASSIDFTLTCTGTSIPTSTVTTTATLCTPQPSATLVAQSCVQTAGTPIQLAWSSSNVDSCTLTGMGSVGTSGLQAVTITSDPTVFTLNCSGDYGPAQSTVSVDIDPTCTATGPGGNGTPNPIFQET